VVQLCKNGIFPKGHYFGGFFPGMRDFSDECVTGKFFFNILKGAIARRFSRHKPPNPVIQGPQSQRGWALNASFGFEQPGNIMYDKRNLLATQLVLRSSCETSPFRDLPEYRFENDSTSNRRRRHLIIADRCLRCHSILALCKFRIFIHINA
jgi:hypothetical protein